MSRHIGSQCITTKSYVHASPKAMLETYKILVKRHGTCDTPEEDGSNVVFPSTCLTKYFDSNQLCVLAWNVKYRNEILGAVHGSSL